MADDAQLKMHKGEIDIDEALVRRLLSEQFPHLAEKPLNMIQSTGTVNAICRIGNAHYARLTRVKRYATSLERERLWLPKLAPHLPLAIPQPAAAGQQSKAYPYSWAVYHWLAGEPYDDLLIDDEQEAAQTLANFVRALRQVDPAGAPRGGRAPLAELNEMTLEAIVASAAVIDVERITAVWRKAVEQPAWEGKPVWIHADLLRPNLLVSGGKITAVIDFGSSGIGDPAFDIIPAWAVFNQAGRETFRRALAVDEASWQRARAYALHQALLAMPYYPKTNPEFVALAKRTIEQIVSDSH